MASRRAALRLTQGLKARNALNSLRQKRNFATPLSYGAATETTTLSNGLTVCCSMLNSCFLELME